MFQVKLLSKSSRAIFSQRNSNFFQSNGKVKWEIARNMNTKSKWVVTIFLSVFLNENTWHVFMKFDIALKQVQSSLKLSF